MEISRDKTAATEGATSIRLRYSRQFQNSGHAHTIDAEATLAVGASSERREQVIRELELSVEQLVRQITQHGSYPASEAYPQTSARSGTAQGRATEPPAAPPLPRPASYAAQPTAPLPVSESMPTAPTASGERTINLPYFIDYIKKRWNMSGQEAMELLDVRELTGLNLREALFKLRDIKEPSGAMNASSTQTRARTTQQQPAVEAPRQANRSTPSAPNSRPTASTPAPNTAPVTTPPGHESPSIPRAKQSTPPFATVPEPDLTQPESEHESRPDFAGSSKAPLPIQLGVVRDLIQPSYGFAEEDGEEEYDLPEDSEEDMHRQAAERRLEKLKELRSGNAASPERLNVLNNVIGEQISEEQLEQIIKTVSGSPNKKRLKIQQVEELISWAKEDYFAEEVTAILEPLNEGEE